MSRKTTAVEKFHPAVQAWFTTSFDEPTRAQTLGWPSIASGDWTLISAPTGSGKTLTAFLWALDRLMFSPVPPKKERCRVVYVSPLKALAVDVERNLRAPLAGVGNLAAGRGGPLPPPAPPGAGGHTPPRARGRFRVRPRGLLPHPPRLLFPPAAS